MKRRFEVAQLSCLLDISAICVFFFQSVRREKFENVRNLAQFRTRCEELDTLLTKVQQQSIEYRGLAEAENTAKEQLEVTNKQLTSLLEDSRQQCADWTKVMAEERGKHQQREAEFQEELLKKVGLCATYGFMSVS